MRDKTAYYIATVFNIGKLPVAPGTWGSLAGFLLFLFTGHYPVLSFILFIILFMLGVAASDIVAGEAGKDDPSYIVIDEFACVFAAFLFLTPTPARLVAGFCLYRLLDILKPPPIKHLERIRGGWGIMLDDLAAGIYTNIILRLAVFLGVF